MSHSEHCQSLVLRNVTSSAHPGRQCQPCILCKKGNLSKYFHPKTIKNKTNLEHLRQLEPLLVIQPDSCICRCCRDDISKLSEPGFTPRWRKHSAINECCCVPNCSTSPQKVTKLVTREELCHIFSISDEENLPANESGFPLCIIHYGELYRHLHPVTRNCTTCKKRITDCTKSRKCPNPALVQSFLCQNTNFTGEITANNQICNECYKAHLVVIKHSNSAVESLDEDLASVIRKLRAELRNEGQIHTKEQVLTHAVWKSAIFVGKTLLDQNAILLCEVWEYFEKIVSDVSKSIPLHHNLHDIANSNWLLSQISVLLEQHMAYHCSVKRYGTVIYRSWLTCSKNETIFLCMYPSIHNQ